MNLNPALANHLNHANPANAANQAAPDNLLKKPKWLQTLHRFFNLILGRKNNSQSYAFNPQVQPQANPMPLNNHPQLFNMSGLSRERQQELRDAHPVEQNQENLSIEQMQTNASAFLPNWDQEHTYEGVLSNAEQIEAHRDFLLSDAYNPSTPEQKLKHLLLGCTANCNDYTVIKSDQFTSYFLQNRPNERQALMQMVALMNMMQFNLEDAIKYLEDVNLPEDMDDIAPLLFKIGHESSDVELHQDSNTLADICKSEGDDATQAQQSDFAKGFLIEFTLGKESQERTKNIYLSFTVKHQPHTNTYSLLNTFGELISDGLALTDLEQVIQQNVQENADYLTIHAPNQNQAENQAQNQEEDYHQDQKLHLQLRAYTYKKQTVNAPENHENPENANPNPNENAVVAEPVVEAEAAAAIADQQDAVENAAENIAENANANPNENAVIAEPVAEAAAAAAIADQQDAVENAPENAAENIAENVAPVQNQQVEDEFTPDELNSILEMFKPEPPLPIPYFQHETAIIDGTQIYAHTQGEGWNTCAFAALMNIYQVADFEEFAKGPLKKIKQIPTDSYALMCDWEGQMQKNGLEIDSLKVFANPNLNNDEKVKYVIQEDLNESVVQPHTLVLAVNENGFGHFYSLLQQNNTWLWMDSYNAETPCKPLKNKAEVLNELQKLFDVNNSILTFIQCDV